MEVPPQICAKFSQIFNTVNVHGYRESFPGGKAAGHEVDHLTPSTDEVKNEWNYTSSPPVCLHVVDRNNFTFSLLPCTFYKFCSRHVLRKCIQHYKPFNINVCRFTTMSQIKPSFTSATTYYNSEAKVC